MSEIKHYIRFGEIPPNEVSGIYRAGEKIGEEIGVSVYNAVNFDGVWRIVLPEKLTPEVGFDLYNFINAYNQKDYLVDEAINMYLVTGREVGRGTTNEPLLKDVRIIAKL